MKLTRGRGPADTSTQEAIVVRESAAGGLPRVNLLPARVVESIRLSSLVRNSLIALVIFVLAVGVLWWLAGSSIDQAQSRVSAVQAQNASMQARVQELSPIGQVNAQLTQQQDLVHATVSSSTRVVEILTHLKQAAGTSVNFTDVGLTMTGIPKPGGELNTCTNPDPFKSDITVGCLTFKADAASAADVSRLLAALEADPLFVGPYLSTTSLVPAAEGKAPRVTFDGTAGISVDALVTPLTAEKLEEIRSGVTPEASPSASPSGGP